MISDPVQASQLLAQVPSQEPVLTPPQPSRYIPTPQAGSAVHAAHEPAVALTPTETHPLRYVPLCDAHRDAEQAHAVQSAVPGPEHVLQPAAQLPSHHPGLRPPQPVR